MPSTIEPNLNATDTINLIQLTWNSPIGQELIFVLVEGDDDCKLYPKFFQQDKCNVEQVHGGYGQLETVVAKLQDHADKIVGIKDADFCHLSKTYLQFQNLFYTDCHDIEMTMIQNDTVFENILYEYSLQTEVKNVKQNILEEASFLGYVRYYNEVKNCSINFRGLSFDGIVTKQNGNIRLQKNHCLQELNKRSPNKTITIDEDSVKQFILANQINDLYQLVSGHDFIKLLQHRTELLQTAVLFFKLRVLKH
jgi:hypothetical protein